MHPRDVEAVLDVACCLRRIDWLTFGNAEEQLLATYEAQQLQQLEVDRLPLPELPASTAAVELARELVVLARAETLTTLGEQARGAALVKEWVREQAG